MAIKTMTLEDVKKLPPLIDEQLAQAKPLYEVHPDWYKVKKSDVHIKPDADVLEWFKSQGKGYRTKINAVLHAYAFG